jgi:Zn finger protein HypA/HybF involved in hydrogenase expression
VHELSLAMGACRIVEDTVGSDRVGRVRTVGVVVGAHSGVEVESFRFCMETLLAQPPFEAAALELEHTGGDELRVDYLEVEDADSED